MSYSDVQPIALAVLTSIITGGFVLVLVEIGNRKNRENDRHDQIMTPFMHKLTAFFRFISWIRSYIIYPKPIEGYNKDFKDLVDEIGGYGGRAITSGGDYGIDYFTADKLNQIALDINNIWYFHDKMNPCKLTWDTRMRGTEELLLKDLREVNPIYLKEKLDVGLVAKASGDFYTDIYQPIEYETYRHEAYKEHYQRQTSIVAVFVCMVLSLLCVMLFWKIPALLLQLATAGVIMMLLTSLMMLAVDVKKQIKWRNMIKEFMEKHKPKSIGSVLKSFWKRVRKIGGVVFSFLLSKMVLIGLLMSAWAILSIEIELIPQIPIDVTAATVAGMNKVFLALSYSYVAGVVIYWFTIVFPQFLKKRRMEPIVKQNVGKIGQSLHNMLLEFCAMDRQNARNPKLDDEADCRDLLINNDWSQLSITPMHAGKRLQEAFLAEYKSMQAFINVFVNDYQDVLSTRQLLLLENIRHSRLGEFLNFSGVMISDYSEFAKDAIAKMFYEIVRNYRELSE